MSLFATDNVSIIIVAALYKPMIEVAKMIKSAANLCGLFIASCLMQKKQLLQNIQSRFSSIPTDISLADELIAARRFDA